MNLNDYDDAIEKVGVQNAIDHDFVDTLSGVKDYIYLKELYERFVARRPALSDRYNFSVFLKTFNGVQSNALIPIAKEIELLIPKFNPPRRPDHTPLIRKDDRPPKSIGVVDFHPICLPLKFKHLIPYLAHTGELYLLTRMPEDEFYYRLIDEIHPDACSIYSPLYKIETAYDKYTVNKQHISYFLPVSWTKLQSYLIQHPEKHIWASKQNKFVENEIYKHLSCKPYERFTDKDCAYYEKYFGLNLNHEQKTAVTDAIENSLTLLQGNAGCGKSTISMMVAEVFLQAGEKVLFLTISTKARNLLRSKIDTSFVSHKPAAHTYAKWAITHSRVDNIIVDESSMIGNEQLLTLLRARSKRLILMGDAKQILPVKQIGCPFISLQNGTFEIKKSVLTIQNRQASDNPLVHFIQETVKKNPLELPEYTGELEGVFYKTLNEDKFVPFYSELKCDNFFCIKPAHYELLSIQIQRTIQKGNPIKTSKSVYNPFNKIYLDEPVIRSKAAKLSIVSQDLLGNVVVDTVEVPNGTLGVMTSRGVEYSEIKHKGVPVLEKVFAFDDFQLAYALSAHKTQGSEYDVVLLALHNVRNLQFEGGKNIFYSSITRAKKLLVICGSHEDKALMRKTIETNFACPIHTLDRSTNLTMNRIVPMESPMIYRPLAHFEPRYSSPFKDNHVVKGVVIEEVEEAPKDNYLCKCGASIKYASKKAHEQSKKHKSFIKIDF